MSKFKVHSTQTFIRELPSSHRKGFSIAQNNSSTSDSNNNCKTTKGKKTELSEGWKWDNLEADLKVFVKIYNHIYLPDWPTLVSVRTELNGSIRSWKATLEELQQVDLEKVEPKNRSIARKAIPKIERTLKRLQENGFYDTGE